jgi:broad specificity phosphatase PhoE
MDLYIFRHGQTIFSKNHLPYGENERTAAILPEAVGPTERLAKYFSGILTEANFSSEFLRCRQTVEIVERMVAKKFVFDPRLNEISESNLEFFVERVKNFWQSLNDQHLGSVAICTHGGVMAVLKHLQTGGNFMPTDILDYPKCGVLMIIRDKVYEEIDFNV